jgi:hypothetical protein
MLTGTHALTALDASHRLGTGTLGHDLDAGQIRVELLIECFGTGTDALQASHALHIFLYSELLHIRGFSFM